MKTNVLQFPEMPSGKSTRQEHFERLLTDTGIDLDELFQEAHHKTMIDAQSRDIDYQGRAFMATTMSWNLHGLLKEWFANELQYDEQNRPYLRLAADVRLYFKKLDQKYRPSNIPTKHVVQLNTAQGHLFGTSTTVLYAGYKLSNDKTWDEVDSYLVEMKGLKQTSWVSSLSEVSATIQLKKLRSITKPAPIEDIEVRLKLKPNSDSSSEQKVV